MNSNFFLVVFDAILLYYNTSNGNDVCNATTTPTVTR